MNSDLREKDLEVGWIIYLINYHKILRIISFRKKHTQYTKWKTKNKKMGIEKEKMIWRKGIGSHVVTEFFGGFIRVFGFSPLN